jgi:hypothetical protein
MHLFLGHGFPLIIPNFGPGVIAAYLGLELQNGEDTVWFEKPAKNGPDAFDRFVKPELAASCRRLPDTIYHMDGPGQLRHLDSLLTIPELKAIQWVPGAGQPGVGEWPDVYRKIRDAGKRIQFFTSQDPDGWRVFEKIAEQVGGPEGIMMCGPVPPDERDEAAAMMEHYGIPGAAE